MDLEAGLFELVPNNVQVGQRVRPGKVRPTRDAVEPDALVRLRPDGQVAGRVLDQGDGLVGNLGGNSPVGRAPDQLQRFDRRDEGFPRGRVQPERGF